MVAFGANLPVSGSPPRETILASLSMLSDLGLSTIIMSKLYKTPCFPAGAGPDYVNAAALLRYPDEWSAQDILTALHDVESSFGRRRDVRWGMRTLDLDLIAMGQVVLPDRATLRHWIDLPSDQQSRATPDQLILPHPRLQDRAFVLVPVAEIAPDWRHPLLDLTIRQLLAALPEKDRDDVREIPGGGVVKPQHRA